MKKFFNSRSFRYGGIAAAITAGFIIIVILINVFASALHDRFPLAADLTSEGKFSLSEEARGYLEQVDRPVTIHMLSSREVYERYDESTGFPLNRIPRIADELDKACENITVDYIDLVANPAFVQKYSTESLNETKIVVESDLRYFVISAYDLFEFNTSSYEVQEKIELTLLSRVLSCTVDKVPQVVFLTGHDEEVSSLSTFANFLSSNTFELSQASLASSGIPEGTDVIVIAAPKRDYTDSELRQLDAFLADDRERTPAVMFLADTAYAPLPNLDAFLAEWGIKVGDGIISETDSTKFSAGYPTIAVAKLTENEFSEAFKKSDRPVITMNSRPIELLYEHSGNIETKAIVTSLPTAEAVTAEGESDGTGTRTMNVLTTSKTTRYEGMTEYNSYVIAVGSTDFFNATSHFSCLNDELAAEMFNVMSGRTTNDLVIDTRVVSNNDITVTDSQAIWIGIVLFTIGIPLILLVAGIVIWLRRRHL